MPQRSSGIIVVSRFLALVCIAAVLLVAFAAPVHKHSGTDDGGCVLCHATERASTVAIDADAGRPLNAAEYEFTSPQDAGKLANVSRLTCSPRAPPLTILAA